jgi:hypothetical protein
MDYEHVIQLQGLTWYLDSTSTVEYKPTAIFHVSKSDTLSNQINTPLKRLHNGGTMAALSGSRRNTMIFDTNHESHSTGLPFTFDNGKTAKAPAPYTSRIHQTYFYSKNQQDAQLSNLPNNTLHVSDGLSVHHQEFKTVHTVSGICHKIYGPTQGKDGVCRMKTNEELEYLIKRKNTVWFIKSQTLRLAAQVNRMDTTRTVKKLT